MKVLQREIDEAFAEEIPVEDNSTNDENYNDYENWKKNNDKSEE